MTATIARTSRLIELRGRERCAHEMNLTTAFCSEAYRRVRTSFRAAARNNDEQLLAVAAHALEMGKSEEDILRG